MNLRTDYNLQRWYLIQLWVLASAQVLSASQAWQRSHVGIKGTSLTFSLPVIWKLTWHTLSCQGHKGWIVLLTPSPPSCVADIYRVNLKQHSFLVGLFEERGAECMSLPTSKSDKVWVLFWFIIFLSVNSFGDTRKRNRKLLLCKRAIN